MRYLVQCIGKLVGRKAGLIFLRSDVHLEQNVLRDAQCGGTPVYLLRKRNAVDRVDELHLADDVFHLVFLQMTDEMQRAAVICPLGELLLKLLHTVFPADIHSGGDGLTHTGSIVHLRCRNELDLLRVTAAANCRRRNVFLNKLHIFRNAHFLSPYPTKTFIFSKMPSPFFPQCSFFITLSH